MAATPPVFADGEAYEQMMGRWSRLAGETFLDWLALSPGLRWLDVGCGNGAFTELIAERCAPASIEAIDPSEGQLVYARQRPLAKSIEYRQGDAMALPYEEAAFDVAAMALAISFVPDPEQTTAEMKRVVRPGGKVATYMWDILGGGFTMEPIRSGLREMGVDAPLPGADTVRMDSLQQLWTSAGLENVATRRIDITVSYVSFEAFWEANTAIRNSVSNAVASLAAADVERLKERVHGALSSGEDGRVAFAAHANAVKGSVGKIT
jgi:ubiquinone/menaquinone biosynthesis C-methylase UbiE